MPDTDAATVKHFKLKTEVITGKASFGNQYLTSYHTGAGLNAAVVAKGAENGITGFFNETELLFKLGDYDYGMSLVGGEDLYAGIL